MNKLVIFDWGGVIESHRLGEENIFNAIIRIMKRLGTRNQRQRNL